MERKEDMCFCGEFWKDTSRNLGEPEKAIVYEVVYEKETKPLDCIPSFCAINTRNILWKLLAVTVFFGPQ